MKCHKCARPAVVHLTEVMHVDEEGGAKRAVEMHVCMQHAVELGLVAMPAEGMGGGIESAKSVAIKPAGGKTGKSGNLSGAGAGAGSSSGAIVPAHAESSSLALTRDRSRQGGDALTCSLCGMNWGQFKQGGLMGCPHDYEHFQGKLLPLLKRAQEGATEHAGKVPQRAKTVDSDRQVVTLRLRRELQKALHAEHYEQAAQLRDKLRQLEN